MLPKWWIFTALLHFTLADFQHVMVQYSLSEGAEYKHLGSISIERSYDGNYTGIFLPKVDSNALWHEMRDASKAGSIYRIRSEIGKDAIETFNEPCLMLRSGLAHQFRATIDPDQQTFLSLSVFPEGLYAAGSDYRSCNSEEMSTGRRLRGTVAVTTVVALPVPDTESYIQKMEKERQARQHGAQQDNRSWIQKYWMYIAAAFVFMLIMNATAGDQGE